MIGALSRKVEFREDVTNVLLYRALRDPQRFCDAAVGAAFSHQLEHLPLARGQLGEALVPAASSKELADESWVNDRSAGSDPLECADEVCCMRDPVFEQVADSLARLEQLDRNVELNMSRKQQDPDVRELGPDPACGVKAFPGMARRHPDIEHNEVWGRFAHGAQERLRVPHLGGDSVPGSDQHTGNAFTKEHIIIGDDNTLTRHSPVKCISAGATRESGR